MLPWFHISIKTHLVQSPMGENKNVSANLLFKDKTHLLWVLANVWVSADTSAVKLVLAVSSKDLKVKCLVKDPKIVRREVHAQCHLTVGRHNPPEMIQPENDHTGFYCEDASSGPREYRTVAWEKSDPAEVRHGGP